MQQFQTVESEHSDFKLLGKTIHSTVTKYQYVIIFEI